MNKHIKYAVRIYIYCKTVYQRFTFYLCKNIIKGWKILKKKDGKFQKEDFKMSNSIPIELDGKVKVSSKGQIVIPAEVRRAAGIEEGGQELKYHFVNGKVILELEKHLSAEELLGIFDTNDDKGDFLIDLNQAREDRSIEILKKK